MNIRLGIKMLVSLTPTLVAISAIALLVLVSVAFLSFPIRIGAVVVGALVIGKLYVRGLGRAVKKAWRQGYLG